MKLTLSNEPDGFVTIEETTKRYPQTFGRVRLTASEWFLFLSAARRGTLNNVMAISDEMVRRAQHYLYVNSHACPPISGAELMRGLLSAALLPEGENDAADPRTTNSPRTDSPESEQPPLRSG